MAKHRRQIFWGTLSSDTDDFLLQLPQGSPELREIGDRLSGWRSRGCDSSLILPM